MSLQYGIGLDTSQIARDAEKANKIFKNIGDQAQVQATRIDSSLRNAFAFAGGTAAASAFIKQLIDVRGEFQQLEIAFTTMLKSKEKSDKLMQEITDFAATTPFDLKQVAAGTKQLLAYGFTADSVKDNLSMLGNVASGVGSQIGDLIYLYGTLKASGRVTQMDINQFAGRGIPIYEELAKVLGVNREQVRSFVSEGKVGFEQIEKAFQGMTGESGLFYNLMQEQSKSLSGQMSNLGDTISRAFNDIGKSQEDVLSGGISGVSYLVENYQEVGKIIGELVITYGAYKASVMALTAINQVYTASKVGMTTAEIANYVAISATDKAQKLLNATILKNPYVLAAAALVTLGYGMYKLITYQTEAEKAQSKLNDTFKKNNAEIATEQVQIDTLFARLKAAKKGTEEYDAAKKAIFSKYGEYLKNLGDENTALNNIDAAYRAVTESATKAARAKGLASATEQASADYVNKQAILLDKIKSEIESIYGKDTKKSLDIFFQIKPLIQSGKGLESFNKDFLSLFDKTVTQQTSSFGTYTSYTANNMKVLISEGVRAKKTFEDINKEAELLFGESPTKPANQLKDGDTKTEGGVDYVYKGGKWEVVPKTKTKEEADKAKKSAQEKADLELKLKNDTIKSGFEQRQAELDKQTAITNAMHDGFLKQKQIIEDEHNQKLLDIDRRTQELIEKQQEEERLLWEANGSKGTFKPKTTTADQLDTENKNLLGTWKQTVQISFVSNSEKLLKDLNDTYLSFTEKKREIDLKYTNDETLLKGTFTGDVLVEKLAVLKSQYKSEIESLQSDFISSNGSNFNGLLNLYLFGEGEDFIQQKIKEAFPQIKDFADLTASQLGEIKKYIGTIEFTPEQLETFKKLGIDIEKLKQNLKNAKTDGSKFFEKEEWEKIIDYVGQIVSSVGQLGDSLQGFGGAVGQIGSALSGLASQAGNVLTIFSKDAKPEDIASAGISGLSSLIGMVANQIQANKEAQSEWNAKIEEGKHQMALMRIEAEGYKEANLFGVENPYSRAIAGAKQYAQSTKELYNATKALENGQTQTGTKKVVDAGNVAAGVGSGAAIGAAVGSFIPVIGNLVGAGIGALVGGIVGLAATKTVPVFESLKSKYGEVVDSAGNLNQQLIADYDKLDEETKQLVDNWEEIKAKQEEAQEMMKQNFSDLAGDLGSSLSDALVDAFKNDKLYSAIDTFDAKMNDVISGIVSQLIFNSIFGQMFNDLESKFNESFSTGGDQNIVDELVWFNENYQKNLDAYNQAMEAANKEMKNSGLAGFENVEERTGATKGFAQASQDSINELNGRFTAVQGHTFRIAESVEMLRSNSGQALKHLAGIETNTSKLDNMDITLTQVKSGIDTINLKGVKIQ